MVGSNAADRSNYFDLFHSKLTYGILGCVVILFVFSEEIMKNDNGIQWWQLVEHDSEIKKRDTYAKTIYVVIALLVSSEQIFSTFSQI